MGTIAPTEMTLLETITRMQVIPIHIRVQLEVITTGTIDRVSITTVIKNFELLS